MKNLIQKNQLMITALAVMLAIAGYLQFAKSPAKEKEAESLNPAAEVLSDNVGTGLGETEVFHVEDPDILTGSELTLVDTLDMGDDVFSEDYLDAPMEVLDAIPSEGEIPGEAVFSAANGVTILADAKLLKEQVRAKNKETLLELVNNETLSPEQRQIAVSSMVAMVDYAEQEAGAEILLEAKGFEGAVVSINAGGVDVVVNEVELNDAQRAQIEDIVRRKTGQGAENIVISTLVP